MVENKISIFLLELNKRHLKPTEKMDIEKQLRQEIQQTIANVTNSALQKVNDLCESNNEPLRHLELVDRGGYLQISSNVGFNFDKPGYSMLPSLLKNAKISKEGYRYKVIPIGKKSHSNMEPIKDIASGMRALEASPMEDMARSFNNAASVGIIKDTSSSMSATGKQEFRTASEKQDISAAWQMPEKKFDLSSEIEFINGSIISEIDSTVEDIIRVTLMNL